MMTNPDPSVLRAGELVAALPATTAADLVELARLALGDLDLYEREGGDLVGTDAYPILRDAWPAIASLLEHHAGEVRLAAAYALAFVLEPADETLPRLERAAATEADPATQAGLLLAAARLEASVALRRGDALAVPWEGIALDEPARAAAPLARAALALRQVFMLPRFPRKVQPEVADALDAIGQGTAVGPWGGGDLRALIAGLRGSLWVQRPAGAEVDEDAGDDEGEEEAAAEIGDAAVADPYTQRRPERQPPRVVLAGLRDVDWASLEHAYGDAGGVPGMIDGLSSPLGADRAWAIEALGASIHHQGSVYPASTAAVPFLVQVAAAVAIEDRERILALLCGIAVHEPDQCLVQGARRWRSEAYAAVVAGGPTYLRLLADADARVRTGAAYLLAYLDPPPPGALDALRAALAGERDRRARASELLAIGYVSRYLETTEDRARLEAYLDDDTPLIRGAAALGLMQLAGSGAPAAARAVLGRLPGEIAPVRGFFPWAGGDVASFARTVRLAFQTDDELWPAIDAVLAGGGDRDDAGRAAGRLYRSLFFDEVHGVDRPWLPTELDAPRQKLLRYFLATTPVKEQGSTLLPFWEGACDAGLFPDAGTIARLLGERAGPLDRELTLDGEARPLWAWIIAANAGVVAPATLLAAAAALPTAERLAVIDDVLAGEYRLTSPRWHTEYGAAPDHPQGPDRANDYTSRCVVLLADLAGGDDEAVTWARALATTEAAAGARRSAMNGLVAAIVLGRDAERRGVALDPALDALCAFDKAPAGTYREALRVALRLLPADRAERLILSQPLYAYQAYVDPRGEVRRWSNRGGWALIDLAPPAVVARVVLAALREWERHRGAGDDRGAQPVLGTTTSSIESKPGPDEPFPRDRAIALLGGAGDAALAAIDAALAEGAIQDRELLAAARTAALAGAS